MSCVLWWGGGGGGVGGLNQLVPSQPPSEDQLLSGVLHLRREWTAPRQKLPNLPFPQWLLGASCSLCAVVGTQFAHSQKHTQNSWNNQLEQKIEKTDCQLPRISRWERARRQICQPEFSITRSMVMELPKTKVLRNSPQAWRHLWKERKEGQCAWGAPKKPFLKVDSVPWEDVHTHSALAEGTQQSGSVGKKCRNQWKTMHCLQHTLSLHHVLILLRKLLYDSL